MKRKSKLILNSCFIIIILFCIYYFGGLYFSKENYIADKLRSFHINQADWIMEFEKDERIITVLHDKQKDKIALIGSKKMGFFYVSDSSSTKKIEAEKNVVITGMVRNKPQLVVIYRVNPDVSKVVAYYENGIEKEYSRWIYDFEGMLIESDEWVNGIYKVYDSNDELIEIIEY